MDKIQLKQIIKEELLKVILESDSDKEQKALYDKLVDRYITQPRKEGKIPGATSEELLNDKDHQKLTKSYKDKLDRRLYYEEQMER